MKIPLGAPFGGAPGALGPSVQRILEEALSKGLAHLQIRRPVNLQIAGPSRWQIAA